MPTIVHQSSACFFANHPRDCLLRGWLCHYKAEKRATPLFRSHRETHTDRNRFASKKQLIYLQKPNVHPGRSINPTNSSTIYPKPPNKVIMTAPPCLMGTISFVQVNVGILTPRDKPTSAMSSAKETSKRTSTSSCIGCRG